MGSREASSSGERMYAPGYFMRARQGQADKERTVGDSDNVSEGYAGIHLDLLEVIVITLSKLMRQQKEHHGYRRRHTTI